VLLQARHFGDGGADRLLQRAVAAGVAASIGFDLAAVAQAAEEARDARKL